MGLANLFGYGKQQEASVIPSIESQSQSPGVAAKGGTALSYFGLSVNIVSHFTKIPEGVKTVGKGASLIGSLQKANGVAGVLGTGVEAVSSAFVLRPEIRLVGKGLTLWSRLKGTPIQDTGNHDKIGSIGGMLPTAFATGAVVLETLAPYAPAMFGAAVPVVGQIGTGLAILNAGYSVYNSYTKV